MQQYLPFIIVTFACILIGILIGALVMHLLNRRIDGTFVVDLSDDGQREVVRFVLDRDFDELIKYKKIILKVENNLSKNSQL